MRSGPIEVYLLTRITRYSIYSFLSFNLIIRWQTKRFTIDSRKSKYVRTINLLATTTFMNFYYK